jgi:hypothetical protein
MNSKFVDARQKGQRSIYGDVPADVGCPFLELSL